MDQKKSSAKSDVRIKLPGPAKWDTKKTFSTSALKALWEHPRKRNNFSKVAWKLWEPQHQAYLSHMFLVRSFKRSLFFVDGERKVALKWNKTKTGTVLSGAIKSFSSHPTLKWKIYNWTEPPQKRQTKIAVFKLMMQIDNFPSNYGRSPSITGAVPGTNPWTPAKRLVANVLTLHFLNQPLLAGHLNQLTHHESHTGGRDMTSVLMILLVRRQGCKMSKRSPKDINCGKKKSPFPSNRSL